MEDKFTRPRDMGSELKFHLYMTITSRSKTAGALERELLEELDRQGHKVDGQVDIDERRSPEYTFIIGYREDYQALKLYNHCKDKALDIGHDYKIQLSQAFEALLQVDGD